MSFAAMSESDQPTLYILLDDGEPSDLLGWAKPVERCRHGKLEPHKYLNQDDGYLECPGSPTLREAEPVGTLTSTAGGTGRITYNVDTDGVLPEGKYLIVPKEADGEQ